jgi:hypothetical protein
VLSGRGEGGRRRRRGAGGGGPADNLIHCVFVFVVLLITRRLSQE